MSKRGLSYTLSLWCRPSYPSKMKSLESGAPQSNFQVNSPQTGCCPGSKLQEQSKHRAEAPSNMTYSLTCCQLQTHITANSLPFFIPGCESELRRGGIRTGTMWRLYRLACASMQASTMRSACSWQ